MTNPSTIENIAESMEMREHPTVTVWNRLETRARRENFDRSLRAEIRDPLWMLTRQWQMGEFKGDDAGSPATAKILINNNEFNKYKADDHQAQTFKEDILQNNLPEEVPLEAKVERRPIPLYLGTHKISLDLRLQMGRQWLKMLKKDLAEFTQGFIEHDMYSIKLPNPDVEDDDLICAHPEVWAQFAAVAERMMDGAELYIFLKKNPNSHSYEHLEGLSGSQIDAFNNLEKKFIHWVEQLYYQPLEEKNDAWLSSNLEYQFSCSAPQEDGEQLFTANEYYHGHLDWYNLDVGSGNLDGNGGTGSVSSKLHSFIPAPIVFDGMPNTRWWAFEDKRTNFGNIKSDTTDLAKLLLMEFGLVYANDWFLLPLTLSTSAVSKIKAFVVKNVFGETFWIGHASKSAESWQDWTMFSISDKDSEKVSELGVLLPTVAKIQEGPPMEDVNLVRDEVANMVWGIEKTIPLADGSSRSGAEAAIQFHNYLQKRYNPEGEETTPAQEEGAKANIQYQLMNTVPENWIPFINVHLEEDDRETQLQRAAMPRILEGAPNEQQAKRIRPRSILLREGLDPPLLDGADHQRKPYFIHEEEVPRAGVLVSQSFQRTRWYNGQVYTWLGVRKRTGRGEGASGLAYDQLIPVGK